MRIALFSDNFYPELSGISDSIILLSKELVKLGHEITFYAPHYSRKNFLHVGLEPKELEMGPNVKVIRFASIPFASGTGQGRAVIPTGLRWVSMIGRKHDVIHTQLFGAVGIEALVAAKVLRKPIVGTNHTALKEFLRYAPIQTEWFKNLAIKYVNWYYESCNITTAPSHSVFKEMDELGFRGKSKVISNPIDTVTFHPLPHARELKKKFGFSSFTILHAGRLAPERNVDVLVKVMPLVKKEVPEAKLVIAGKGVMENELRSLAKSLGVEDMVIFLGFLDHKTLNEVYNASEVFAIASTSDTQSLVMMQGMACGLPTVGVRARALPEYINDENGFVAEPNDVEGIATHIISLSKHPDLRKRLGGGGLMTAKKFSAPEIAKAWELIYKGVITNYNQKK